MYEKNCKDKSERCIFSPFTSQIYRKRLEKLCKVVPLPFLSLRTPLLPMTQRADVLHRYEEMLGTKFYHKKWKFRFGNKGTLTLE
jgi:hypothetical protein